MKPVAYGNHGCGEEAPMSKHMLWITLACAPACTIGQGVVLTGEMSAAPTAQPPDSIDIVVVFGPERADHSAVGTTVYGSYPSAFTLGIDPLPRSVFEDDKGYRIASGSVWIAKAGVSGSREDGFAAGELIQPAGYAMLYLVDDPGDKRPFGVDAQIGWNLLQRVAPTCEDRTVYPSGGEGWKARYELLPIESPLSVQLYPALTVMPWDVLPTNCP
jgi:hypothetical protein